MNPKLRGLTSGLDRLKDKFDKRTDELVNRLPELEKRGDAAFDEAHKHLDAKAAEFAEVESFIKDLEAVGNGGPTFDGSKEPSQTAEPGASWSGKAG